MSEELAHYDTIASALLSVASTMIAIIASLVPIARAQNALTTWMSTIFVLTTLLLGSCIVLSVLGLLTKNGMPRKRVLCVLPALPLIISILLLMTIMF